jgi:hypothetical protein
MTHFEYTAGRWSKIRRDPEIRWRWEVACFENRLRRKKGEELTERLRLKRGALALLPNVPRSPGSTCPQFSGFARVDMGTCRTSRFDTENSMRLHDVPLVSCSDAVSQLCSECYQNPCRTCRVRQVRRPRAKTGGEVRHKDPISELREDGQLVSENRDNQ